MNQLNETLRAIRTTIAILQKQLNNTSDENQKQKLQHQIHCLTMEEQDTLNQLNIRLDDITLTAPYEKPKEEDDNQ